MKTCTKCNTRQSLSSFSKKTATKLQSRCKECFKSILRDYREQNKHAISARRRANYAKDPTKFNKQNHKSYIKNRTKRVKHQTEYTLHKLNTDLAFKLKFRIRDFVLNKYSNIY